MSKAKRLKNKSQAAPAGVVQTARPKKLSRESSDARSIRLQSIMRILRKIYPDAVCSLDYETPFQLLTATILAAQCTDVRINKISPNLFQKFPDAEAMSKAKAEDLEELIRTAGFFRAKSKSLMQMSKALVEKHGGQVPESMEELSALQGVGRKTANVVLGNAFHNPAGVVVDTHVKRLSFRLGLTTKTDPHKIELELNDIVPKKFWTDFPHWLIYHGRQICMAKNPQCQICPLNNLCPKKA